MYLTVEGERVSIEEYRGAFAGRATCSTEPLTLSMIRGQHSALTAPSVAASLPGLARHIESADTPPTDEQTDQSNTGTGYGFEVLSSSGERESQTVAWY